MELKATVEFGSGLAPAATKKSGTCPLCGGGMEPWMMVPGDWRRPDVQEKYALHWCRSCLFGQMLPRPEPEKIASFYAGDAYYTHARDPAPPGGRANIFMCRLRVKLAWRFDHEVLIDDRWLRTWLKPGTTVCDLGCGKGAMLTHIRSQGFVVTGVEPDARARMLAREDGLDVLPGTAEELPEAIRGRRFGGVVMSHMLEHCLDPCGAVQNAAGLLAEGREEGDRGGILMIETPNNESYGLALAEAAWPWLDVPRHLNFFTARSLQRVCEAVGLKVLATQYRGYTRQFLPDWQALEDQVRRVLKLKRGASGWRLLLRTLLAKPRYKYDSVRVVATLPS